MKCEKIALITGSSRGLGFEVAKILDCRGFSNILVGRSKAGLDTALAQLVNQKHYAFPLDLLNGDAIHEFLEQLIDNNTIPSVLVHSLGGKVHGDEFPLNREILQRSLEIILDIAIKINEKFIPYMIKANFGRIIHIGSDASLTGKASPAYVIAKAALNGYVKSMAQYYAKNNIMFCGVLPGIFEHEGSAWAEKKISNPDYYKKRLEQMPLGRFGRPEEVATLIAELADNSGMMYAGGLFELCAASR